VPPPAGADKRSAGCRGDGVPLVVRFTDISAYRIPSRGVVPALLAVLPAAVAAAWIPLRSHLPNADVALLLVLCVGAVATVGGRWPGIVGSVAGATAFDLFDTPPYGQLLMNRASDVITTVVLVAAGIIVAELCVRLHSYRVIAARRGEDFTVLSGAARLMSFGEEPAMVVGSLAGELVTRVGLKDCEFRYGPPTGDRPCVARDGSLLPGDSDTDADVTEIDLPVWAGTEVVGCYRLSLSTPYPPAPDRLLAAVGIAEQAGAALAGWDELPPPVRPRRLRLVR
jgi:Domain of unknown function (DUF4118)